jgi:SPFH domain/Band 7 family protein
MPDSTVISEIVGSPASLVVSGLGLSKTFNYVKEGELGIKLRFGKASRDKDGKPRVIPPGFVMMIPWVDTLAKHHVRQQTSRFSPVQYHRLRSDSRNGANYRRKSRRDDESRSFGGNGETIANPCGAAEPHPCRCSGRRAAGCFNFLRKYP